MPLNGNAENERKNQENNTDCNSNENEHPRKVAVIDSQVAESAAAYNPKIR